MKLTIKLITFCTLCLLLVTKSTAQQRTGNIVEYFGKEKVEEIHEGKVIHVFKNALTLKLNEVGINSSTFPQDPVFARFLMDDNYLPKAGEVFDLDYLGDEMKWTPIGTDKTNTFTEAGSRSGYVYVTYTSGSAKDVIFEASGHAIALINGFPHEGDHYDFGYTLIPMRLKKGLNVFVLKSGRFSRIRARLLSPPRSVQITPRDMTLPDLLVDSDIKYKGGVRIVNSSGKWIKGVVVKTSHSDKSLTTPVPAIAPYQVRKVAVNIPSAAGEELDKEINVKLELQSKSGKEMARQDIVLKTKSKHSKHKKTFVSDIDGSVQYYSVAPTTNKKNKQQALFLSVHGASVEAVNQANAYKQKDWGNVVAPTNRRPFGFAWEDWGRLDALEVLEDSRTIFKPDPQRIYLTGHSMGGHGTWYLGATYPDKFAAIAPCAGYPDLLLYRDSFLKRMLARSPEQLKARGYNLEQIERLSKPAVLTPVEKMIARAGNPSRTIKLIRNYLHLGVYVLHGEKDNVVPTYLARDMRERLGKFHNDFTYYEYPGGTHWYGDHSMDWPPIFNFFKQRTIKSPETIENLEFYTGSPGVSARSNFISIHQQERPFEISSFKFTRGNNYEITTKNTATIQIDLDLRKDSISELKIDGTEMTIAPDEVIYLKKNQGAWEKTTKPDLKEKGPHRNGGFKDAFKNNVVFVYGTTGTTTENKWNYNKAQFDAETFWYRANGNIELVRDRDFKPSDYPDRNVILYGNSDTNSAWNVLLKGSEVQVKRNHLTIGEKTLLGDQWGMYFIVPRSDSNLASIGVVTATGYNGMKAGYANHYLVNGTTFPDLLLFDNSVLIHGEREVKGAGFFGNDWSVEKGEFKWK